MWIITTRWVALAYLDTHTQNPISAVVCCFTSSSCWRTCSSQRGGKTWKRWIGLFRQAQPLCGSQSLVLQSEHGAPAPGLPHLASSTVLGNLKCCTASQGNKNFQFPIPFGICKDAVGCLRNTHPFQLENCSRPELLEASCVFLMWRFGIGM